MKTPATAFLASKGIAYTEHYYEYVEHGGTEVPAQVLGVPERQVVKTLVMEDEARKPLIVLMHGDRKVSTKNLARQAGRKSVEPCKPEVAQRHTGYQVGGTSPFGTRKNLPVFVERSILELPEIYINGGQRGLLVKVRSADLAVALALTLVDVALS
jgi:Cys-tRNA(Pro) deacylase